MNPITPDAAADDERRRLAAQPPPHIAPPDEPLPRIGQPHGPILWAEGRDDDKIAAHKAAAASRRWREETRRAHAAEDVDHGHGH